MKKNIIGERYIIHSYKHVGSIHRAWDEAILLDETDEYLVFGNDRTKVIESDGRSWKTKEPAIMYFFKDKWYNVIGQYKKDGIYYYCNIASPCVIDQKTIKYIDYDLDLRVFPDGAFKILDRGEYNYHKNKMNYSDQIDTILKSELSALIELARAKSGPFEKEQIEYYYPIYKKYKNELTIK
jgi:protein associated with RNAse G/E